MPTIQKLSPSVESPIKVIHYNKILENFSGPSNWAQWAYPVLMNRTSLIDRTHDSVGSSTIRNLILCRIESSTISMITIWLESIVLFVWNQKKLNRGIPDEIRKVGKKCYDAHQGHQIDHCADEMLDIDR